MSKTLVTGATGLIGYNIVLKLLERGRSVRVLARNNKKAAEIFKGLDLVVVQGDITDAESLNKAMEGCDVVYHAAGLPEQWLRDNDTFRQVNVEGTRKVVQAALKHKVKRFLYTSTIDVFQGEKGKTYTEAIIDPQPKGTYYERSKQQADQVVQEAMDTQGLPAVFLHPAGLYGPGPAGSPGMNNFITDLALKKIPAVLPGGLPLIYCEDVGEAHVLAEEKASLGERFILSDTYFTLPDLTAKIISALGMKKVPGTMPLWLAKTVSSLGELLSRLIKQPPLIPAGQLTFMQWGAIPDASFARERLGWNPLSFGEALPKTVNWLREQGKI